ncbi:hypothetical protein DM860_015482 [Cuscuta australis]|uniref:Uncharacterized protein n=1 Tax=Cuscuta australis TaxID=267555 RepID=A0A328E6X5_9ASTE|nr:hypothetical protein DM860_015482 [Cuscuta australis]
MATRASQLVQDQNVAKLPCSGASAWMNNDSDNVSMGQKKGGKHGSRRALNDISNSTKPCALLQASKKANPSTVLVEKNVGVSKTKKRVGGRRALGDLTNSSKQYAQQVPPKKDYNEEEELFCVAEEGFMHNHDKCIKEQMMAMDMGCFLKEAGLANDSSNQFLMTPHAYPPSLRRTKLKSAVKDLEMEELPELPVPLNHSPVLLRSPMSPKAQCVNWKDDSFPAFSLIETPMLPNTVDAS